MTSNWKKLLLLTLVTGVASASSITKKAKELGFENLDLDISSSFASLQGSPDKANKFRFSIMADTEFTLTNNIMFVAYAGFKYEAGNSNASFNEKRYAPSTRAVYSHAYIKYAPIKPIELQAGALDNRDNEAVSIFANYGVSSLGAREKLSFGTDNFKVNITATQAMPSNDDLSDEIGTVKEETPKFFSEMVNIELNIGAQMLYAQAGHFAYQDLSSSVAYTDKFYGNTVTGTTETDSAYAYNFKGWVSTVGAKLQITKSLMVNPEAEMIKNDEAPEGLNSGRVAKLNLETEIINHKIKASFGNFDNESDTAPAYYSKTLYKNDYKGNFVDLRIDNPENLETTFKFVDRKTKSNSAFIGDEKVYSLTLRKSYDIF